MVELLLYRYLFDAFAFVIGAVVGSFLNVCIYRLPLDLSVNEPKRSFCPLCKKQIPWSQNLPLISWLALRGHCSQCGGKIPFRYFGVELLTALLFLSVWLKFQATDTWFLTFPYWILVSLLIVATFIDFEHFIIPDGITWGGTGAGIVLSLALPALMDQDSFLRGLLWSAIGAASGYGLLWVVVELGKKAFGKKRHAFEKEEEFAWVRNGDDAELSAGPEKMLWSDLFSRETDRLEMECSGVKIDEEECDESALVFFYNRVIAGTKEFALEKLGRITGKVTAIVIPREAMGFGDVKFIAAIGAFLGWKAVLFTVVIGSVAGSIVGLGAIIARRREWSAKIPFGTLPRAGSARVALLWAGNRFLVYAADHAAGDVTVWDCSWLTGSSSSSSIHPQ